MDWRKNNCSYSDNPVASKIGREGQTGGKRRGLVQSNTIVKEKTCELHFSSGGYIVPGVQMSGVEGEEVVNCNLSHRSTFKEECWKGQLFETPLCICNYRKDEFHNDAQHLC